MNADVWLLMPPELGGVNLFPVLCLFSHLKAGPLWLIAFTQFARGIEELSSLTQSYYLMLYSFQSEIY